MRSKAAILGWLLAAFFAGMLVVVQLRPASTRPLAPSAPPQAETPSSLQQAFQSVARRIEPSVVNISTEQFIVHRDPFADIFREFFGETAPSYVERRSSLGSGLIIGRDGYVLTNAHVIRGASRITVTLHNGEERQASLVGVDESSDLAVIRIPAGGLVPAQPGDADQVQVGSWAIAIGSPFGFSESLTVGVISARRRQISDQAGERFQNLLQTDASINPGNSGGPLLDIRGEVIGINQAIYSPSGGNVGIGFAIPINSQTRAAVRRLTGGTAW